MGVLLEGRRGGDVPVGFRFPLAMASLKRRNRLSHGWSRVALEYAPADRRSGALAKGSYRTRLRNDPVEHPGADVRVVAKLAFSKTIDFGDRAGVAGIPVVEGNRIGQARLTVQGRRQ